MQQDRTMQFRRMRGYVMLTKPNGWYININWCSVCNLPQACIWISVHIQATVSSCENQGRISPSDGKHPPESSHGKHTSESYTHGLLQAKATKFKTITFTGHTFVKSNLNVLILWLQKVYIWKNNKKTSSNNNKHVFAKVFGWKSPIYLLVKLGKQSYKS